MSRLNYNFFIDYKIICEVRDIAKKNHCQESFLEALEQLCDEAYYRPYKDLHYDLSLVISKYYSTFCVGFDNSFASIHKFLLSKWNESLTDYDREKNYKVDARYQIRSSYKSAC